MPGTTRDAIDSPLFVASPAFRIIDTAGMRRPGRVSGGGKVEMVSVALAKEAIADADVVALVVDASTGAADQDAAIGGEADRAGRGIVIIVNKWDLVKRRSHVRRGLTRRCGTGCAFRLRADSPTSALTGSARRRCSRRSTRWPRRAASGCRRRR